MADKIPTYEKQILPPKKGPAVETPFAMDDAAKAQAYGAKTLEQSATSLYWLHKDLKQMAIKERKDKQAADFAYITANLKKRFAEEAIKIMEEHAYEEWDAYWEKAKTKIVNETLESIKDPDVAQAVNEWLPNATVTFDIDFMTKQAEMRREEGRNEIFEAARIYAESGDVEGVESFFDSLEQQKTTLLTPREIYEQRITWGKEAEKNRIMSMVMADPWNVDPTKAKTKYLDAEELETLNNKRYAIQAKIRQERDANADKILQSWVEDYYTKGYFPSVKEITDVYHSTFKGTPLPLISESDYMRAVKLSETIAEQNRKAAEGKVKRVDPDYETSVNNYMKLYDEFIGAESTQYRGLLLEVENAYQSGAINKVHRDGLKNLIKDGIDGVVESRKPLIEQYTKEAKSLVDDFKKYGVIDEHGAAVMMDSLNGLIEALRQNPNIHLTPEVMAESVSKLLKNLYEAGVIKSTKETDWWSGRSKRTTILEDFYTGVGLSVEKAYRLSENIFNNMPLPSEYNGKALDQKLSELIEKGD